MNKEQQIEEMANYYCEYCKKQTGEKFCEHIDDKSCNIFFEAELFYNAGYRKIPEDSVVLSREEQERILSATEKRIKELKKQIMQAREISKSDIERLKTQLQQANAGIVNCIGCHLVELNAVEEFAEKLKIKAIKLTAIESYHICEFVDELLKEYEQ